MFVEVTAHTYGHQGENQDGLPLGDEDLNPDYMLESYILSVLNVDVGVFSEHSTIRRAFHEVLASTLGLAYLGLM